VYVLPPGLSGIRTVIAFGHSLGALNEYGALTADVDAAYVHARLGGPKTYARLHASLKPSNWDGMKDPCTVLEGALYGVPRSGKDWDSLATGEFIAMKWTKVNDSEGSTYHKSVGPYRLMLTIYIDDLIIGGHLLTCWQEMKVISTKLLLKPGYGRLKRILGIDFSTDVLADSRRLHLSMGNYINGMLRDFKMEARLSENHAFRKTYIPGFEEGSSVLTALDGNEGIYKHLGRRYVGKLLYLVRAARPDASNATVQLSREVDRWTAASDRRLMRLLEHLSTTRDHSLTYKFKRAYKTKDLYIKGFCDSDHGGCPHTGRSTSGWLAFLADEDTGDLLALLDWGSKRQGRASASTAEAELVALADAMMRSALPLASLLEQIFGVPRVIIRQLTDSEACRLAVKKGSSGALRYIRKHQFISLSVVSDFFAPETGNELGRVDSNDNHSDFMTKGLPRPVHEKHSAAVGMTWPKRG